MPESKLIAQFAKGGRRSRPYGYSYLSKRIASDEKLRVIRYVEGVRSGLVQDLGPTEEDLTTAQLLLVDRLCCLLAVCRAIEQHFEENVMDGDFLKGALSKSYISYNNTIRLTLQSLGIEKRASDRVLSPLEFAKQIDQERERRTSK